MRTVYDNVYPFFSNKSRITNELWLHFFFHVCSQTQRARLPNSKPIGLRVNRDPKTGFASSVSVWPRDFLSASALQQQQQSSTAFLSHNSPPHLTARAVTEALIDQNQGVAFARLSVQRDPGFTEEEEDVEAKAF